MFLPPRPPLLCIEAWPGLWLDLRTVLLLHAAGLGGLCGPRPGAAPL